MEEDARHQSKRIKLESGAAGLTSSSSTGKTRSTPDVKPAIIETKENWQLKPFRKRAGARPKDQNQNSADEKSSSSGKSKKSARTAPVQCPVCSKTISQASNLPNHMRTHTGEKIFGCTHCDKRFSDASSRARHVRIHTGEKPYECTVCNKTFNQSTSFRRHERMHAGVKIKCPYCPASYSQRNNLNEHIKTHGNVTAASASADESSKGESDAPSTPPRSVTPPPAGAAAAPPASPEAPPSPLKPEEVTPAPTPAGPVLIEPVPLVALPSSSPVMSVLAQSAHLKAQVAQSIERDAQHQMRVSDAIVNSKAAAATAAAAARAVEAVSKAVGDRPLLPVLQPRLVAPVALVASTAANNAILAAQKAQQLAQAAAQLSASLQSSEPPMRLTLPLAPLQLVSLPTATIKG